MSEIETEYSFKIPDKLPKTEEGEAHEAMMSVAVKTENGHTLTHDYGFTIEEENGKVLAFDMLQHPDLGTTVLFGSQVFALKYWDEEDLHKGLKILTESVEIELQRRKEITNG